MVSCKIACEDLNDHSIDHSTSFTKTSPDSINPHPGGSPSDIKFDDTKVISCLIVLRSPQCKILGTRDSDMILASPFSSNEALQIGELFHPSISTWKVYCMLLLLLLLNIFLL